MKFYVILKSAQVYFSLPRGLVYHLVERMPWDLGPLMCIILITASLQSCGRWKNNIFNL